MTLNERIDRQSFCYDPEFPPDVAEGMPLVSAKRPPHEHGRDAALRRAGRACRQLAAGLRRRG
jgi:hypothetical protein